MDKTELEIKQDENIINDFAENLSLYPILIWLQKKKFYKNLLLKM